MSDILYVYGYLCTYPHLRRLRSGDRRWRGRLEARVHIVGIIDIRTGYLAILGRCCHWCDLRKSMELLGLDLHRFGRSLAMKEEVEASRHKVRKWMEHGVHGA